MKLQEMHEVVREMRRQKDKREQTDGDTYRDHKTLEELRRKVYLRQRTLAIVAAVGVLFGIGLNEVCAAPLYGDTLDPEDDRNCSSGLKEPLKVGQSISTLVLVTAMIIQYNARKHLLLVSTFANVKKHVSSHRLGGSVVAQRASKSMLLAFLCELCVCAIHSPPGLEIAFPVSMLGNKMYYKIESLACMIMLLRLYHVFRWLKEWTMQRYFDLEYSYIMQDHETIRMMHDLETYVSKGVLALKVVLRRHPFPIILLSFMSLMLCTTYLVRLAEGPAGQPHSTYIWDQFWISITQGTTGYGGTTPQTHLGRFAVCVVMVLGPVIVAFVTATATRSLSLTDDEEAMMRNIDANRLKTRVLEASARVLQFWWRLKSGSSLPTRAPHRRAAMLGAAAISGGEQQLQSQVDLERVMLARDLYESIERMRRFYVRRKGKDVKGPAQMANINDGTASPLRMTRTIDGGSSPVPHAEMPNRQVARALQKLESLYAGLDKKVERILEAVGDTMRDTKGDSDVAPDSPIADNVLPKRKSTPVAADNGRGAAGKARTELDEDEYVDICQSASVMYTAHKPFAQMGSDGDGAGGEQYHSSEGAGVGGIARELNGLSAKRRLEDVNGDKIASIVDDHPVAKLELAQQIKLEAGELPANSPLPSPLRPIHNRASHSPGRSQPARDFAQSHQITPIPEEADRAQPPAAVAHTRQAWQAASDPRRSSPHSAQAAQPRVSSPELKVLETVKLQSSRARRSVLSLFHKELSGEEQRPPRASQVDAALVIPDPRDAARLVSPSRAEAVTSAVLALQGREPTPNLAYNTLRFSASPSAASSAPHSRQATPSQRPRPRASSSGPTASAMREIDLSKLSPAPEAMSGFEFRSALTLAAQNASRPLSQTVHDRGRSTSRSNDTPRPRETEALSADSRHRHATPPQVLNHALIPADAPGLHAPSTRPPIPPLALPSGSMSHAPSSLPRVLQQTPAVAGPFTERARLSRSPSRDEMEALVPPRREAPTPASLSERA